MRVKICFVSILSLFLSFSANGQDSIQFQKKIFKIQQQSTLVFSGWSILNIGISPLCSKNLFNPVTSNEHFHLSNFNWNLFNAGFAGLSHYSVYTNSQKNWSIPDLNKRKKRLERVLAVNVALDFIYIASGFLLKHATNPDDLVNYPAFNGGGNSLILQGGFLLIYDSLFLSRIKKIKL
tara:strand:+ start:13431 stop:13967 length:537 start_codon:yes stop_codon:yes gene_type:complete